MFPQQRWQLIYNPEFIALGQIARGMRFPDVSIVGLEAPEQSLPYTERYLEKCARMWQKQPEVHFLEFEAAELAKLAINTFVTTKISFSNLIGGLAKRLGVTHPDRVLRAVGSDPRIGHAYLRPGLGYGGPCFPRDNKALGRSLSLHGLPTDLPDSVDRINDLNTSMLMSDVLARLATLPHGSKHRVLYLGVSYKPGTPVTESSQALRVATSLIDSGVNITVCDPLVRSAGNVPLKMIDDCKISDFDLVVHAVASEEFDAKIREFRVAGIPVLSIA